MKKILSILVLLFFWCEINAPAQQIITATVTITNVNGTANGETILINSTTRTWTNAVTTAGTQILTATNIPMAATNLFLNYAVTPQANVTVSWNSSNVINFQCYAGSGLIASISSGWATISFSTNTLTQAISVRVPPSAVGNYEQSNVESGLATYLNGNKGTNTISTNAPMFLPWYTWISGLWASLNGSLTNFNGTNINSGTITTNSLDQQIYNLLFGGAPVSSVFIPGLEIQYEAGTSSSGGALGTGFTNWVTTNQSFTAFGPYSPTNSHAPPFLNWSRNYDGTTLASMDAEGVWSFGIANFSQLTIGGLPVGSGGGGGTNVIGGPVGTLYNVAFSPGVSVSSYVVTNLVATGITGAYSYLNGTYFPQGTYGQFSINYAGNIYSGWYSYTNSVGQIIYGGVIGFVPGLFYDPSGWNFYSGAAPSTNSIDTSINNTFNLLDPAFNSGWKYLDFYHQVVPNLTPTLLSQGFVTNYSASSTIIWAFADNWNYSLTGVTNLTLSLSQDWKATNAQQVETHKIFLNNATNTCSLIFSQTNLWLWQNRQGLAAVPPISLVSNETMTIDIKHIGGQTNWLAAWDTTAATNGIFGTNGTGGLTVTNWTTNSPAISYTINILYTNTLNAGIIFGDADISSGTSGTYGLVINYTNNGIGYASDLGVAAIGSSVNDIHAPFSFPINNGSTFEFTTNGSTIGNLNFLRAQFWQLPH